MYVANSQYDLLHKKSCKLAREWVLLAEQLPGNSLYTRFISFLSLQHPSDEEQTSILLSIVIIISTVLLMLACIVLVILSTKYQRIARKQVDAAQHEHPGKLYS